MEALLALRKVETKTFKKVLPTYCCFPGDDKQEGNDSSKNIVLCYVFEDSKDATTETKSVVQILECGKKLDPENDPETHSGTYCEVYTHNNQPVYKRT
ncbi:MAG: hypothetical protein KBB86_03195 [Candidatus Pacebacteria bacterium]|nr:hypothetical protein [Candidatus Paceibacterota bacterium]